MLSGPQREHCKVLSWAAQESDCDRRSLSTGKMFEKHFFGHETKIFYTYNFEAAPNICKCAELLKKHLLNEL